MTWKEFKDLIEAGGVRDDDVVDLIGFSTLPDTQKVKTVWYDEDGGYASGRGKAPQHVEILLSRSLFEPEPS